MTPAEATRLLDLPPDATPEQLEARFLGLRRKLEDKIAKAPTPGLQAKYRESLAEVTTAFETLTLAADSSALPVLKKETGGGRPETGAGAPSLPSVALAKDGPREPRAQSPAPKPPARKSGGKEFALVAIIAVVVLGAGGWFILKIRAENAEKARLAAEAKAGADRQAATEKAEQERKAAEEKRLAEEAEKARLAAEAKAEQERLDRLTGQLRGELAGFKVRWEALEKEERNAERRLSELKSDLRSLRDPAPGVLAEAQALATAQQNFYDWLSGILTRHPAKVTRSKAEELLSARQPDAAAAVMDELRAAFTELEVLIPQQRTALTSIRGRLKLDTADTVAWTITDAFGQTRSGEGSADIGGLAVGRARVRFRMALWPDREVTTTIRNDELVTLSSRYETKGVDLASTPDGATVVGPDGKEFGRTPLRVELPPGKWTVTLKLDGYVDQKVELSADAGVAPETVAMRVKPDGLVRPERWSSPARVRIDTRSVMSGSSSSNTQAVEEWDLAKPDGQGGWQQITRKLISRTGIDRTYTPVDGSVMRQQRQPDGKWAGEFTQGGLTDASLNHIWTGIAPSIWLVSLYNFDIWPATEVNAGGTWPVKADVFLRMIGLQNATGNVTGKVLSLEQEDNVDWAVIEFAYTYSTGGMTGQDTLKMHVNLTECYVTRAEGRGLLTHSGGQISSSYTMTVTKR